MIKNTLQIGFLFTIITTFLIFSVQANDPGEMEWGVIPDSLWQIDSFPDDDEAHSIILGDAGVSYIDRDTELVYLRHTRVKILDVDKSNFTDVSIRIYREDRTENLRSLKAHTLNKNPDGSVRIEEVQKREIHTERSGNYETTTFAFPDLQPGSIVEFSYTIESAYITFLKPWDFQHSSPILRSEYRVMVPDRFSYVFFTKGYEEFDKNEIETDPSDVPFYPNMARNRSIKSFHWVLTNAPAVRSEPYITTVSDYKNRVDFQLSGYVNGRGFYEEVLSDWQELAGDLVGNRYFGKQISSNRRMRRMVDELTEGLNDEFEIAQKLYEFVSSEISWNEELRLFTDKGVKDTFDDKRGNSAEKALLLVSLLDIADFNTDPVLISTRGHGKVLWGYPRIAQFNHILVSVELGEQQFILDPVLKEVPFGMLMPFSLNGSGLLIDVDNKEAVQLQIGLQIGSMKDTKTFVEVKEDGTLSGTIQSKFTGYEAIMQRLQAEELENDEYFIENIVTDIPDTELSGQTIKNLEDPDEVFETSVDLTNESYSLVAGDMIYLNPFFTDRISENPFRSPVRNFPVEYAYSEQNSYLASVQIPDGYEIIEAPEDIVIQLDDETVFVVKTMKSPMNFQVLVRFIRSSTFYPAEKYDQIRDFFNEIATVYNQQIVLQKSSDESDMESMSSDEGDKD